MVYLRICLSLCFRYIIAYQESTDIPVRLYLLPFHRPTLPVRRGTHVRSPRRQRCECWDVRQVWPKAHLILPTSVARAHVIHLLPYKYLLIRLIGDNVY